MLFQLLFHRRPSLPKFYLHLETLEPRTLLSAVIPTLEPLDTNVVQPLTQLVADPDSSESGLTIQGLSDVVSGNIFVQAVPDQLVESVTFEIDGQFVRTERSAPYALASDSGFGRINPYDTTQLAEGEHALTATAQLRDGSVKSVTKTFVVGNVESPSVGIDIKGLGSTVSGNIYVQAVPDQPVSAVTFTIDGREIRTERYAPYALGSDNGTKVNPFDTTQLTDGRHTLIVTATLTDGSTESLAKTFLVDNTMTPRVGLDVRGLSSTVTGDIFVSVVPDQPVKSVTFKIDGQFVRTERSAPYALASDGGVGRINPYDTTQLSDGEHTLSATATLADGSQVTSKWSFVVVNQFAQPEPSLPPLVTNPIEPQLPDSGSVPGYSGESGASVSENAIARWDVVPEQSFTGKFEIGVAAYHLGGIDRVEFVVNGQTTVAVRQRSVNPRTNVAEYWMTLDGSALPGGWVTVSATAYPSKGLARELPEIRLYNGEPNWQVIELGAGTHLLSDLPIVSEGWLTIRPKAGVSRDAVDVVVDFRTDSGAIIQRQGNIRFQNLNLRGNDAKGVVYGRGSDQHKVWFDNCVIDGEGRTWRPAGNITAYLSDTEIKGFQVASDGNAELIRGVSVHANYEDVFRNPRFIANTRVWDVDRGDTAGHPDLLEIQPFKCSNIIIQNLTADRIAGQGLYSSNVSDMAVVDSYINTSESGEPWIAAHFLGEHRNILIHNSTFVGSARFRYDKGFTADDFTWSDSTATSGDALNGVLGLNVLI